MDTSATMVPLKVDYAPAWLTWVAATTTCLRALGVECDQVDVAGYSGYAFHLCVHPTLCPSGPTVLSWDDLNMGPRLLGRATTMFYSNQCHCEGFASEITRGQCRSAFDLAKAEVLAGRPSVMWGAYVPEFAVTVGFQGDSFIVKSFKEMMGQEQPPIPFDEINAPGGAYVLAFPSATDLPKLYADKHAVYRAVEMWHTPGAGYGYGAKGYDMWVEGLEGHRADGGGNAYNAACYAEGRRFSNVFFDRMAKRNEFAAEKLAMTSKRYGVAADAMEQVAKLFPFPGAWGQPVTDDGAIKQAVELLREAQDAETQAVTHLAQVLAMEWPKP
jgi:hypothetical protein